MTYKLNERVGYKFVFEVEGDYNTFLNTLYMLNFDNYRILDMSIEETEKLGGFRTNIKQFFKFCKKHNIAPENFISTNRNYLLTPNKVTNVVIGGNNYGLHFKHLLDEKLNEFEYDDVYNFDYDLDGLITYSYLKKDFLHDFMGMYGSGGYWEKKLIICECPRQKKLLLEDYIKLGLYDFDITIENLTEEDGNYEFELVTPNDEMACAVYLDFLHFTNRNKIECPTCNKLVDNAFDEYMVQFYKHDGC